MEGLAAGAAQIEEGIMRASPGLLRQNAVKGLLAATASVIKARVR